jgi:lipopolysaccharide transport system ATP-binding protein
MSSDPVVIAAAPAAVEDSEIVIRVEHLSKCYQVYDKPHHRLWQGLLRGRKQFFREFWALRDVSFEVHRGETVGIIGRNGSGKSTLLQMICGTLTPTAGDVEVRGRVAALLELGAGFNPEFTGRENVYMNGAVLGLSASEIAARFDDIVAFADIGDFVDQPVKKYSSGMFVRLGFSVMVHVDADVLVIDEALAVGDMAFQAKCMARIRQMIESGVTVLFVSHDIGAVKALCNRGLYLERGRPILYGSAADVAGLYVSRSHLEINQALGATALASLNGALPTVTSERGSNHPRRHQSFVVKTDAPQAFGPNTKRYGDGRVTVLDVRLVDDTGEPVRELEVDQPFELQIAVLANADLPSFAWGYSMRDLKGQMLVAMVSTSDPSCTVGPVKRGQRLVLAIRGVNALRAGVYTVSVGIELPVVLNQQHAFLEVVEDPLVFQSIWPADPRGSFPGLVKTPVAFSVLAGLAEDNHTQQAGAGSALDTAR